MKLCYTHSLQLLLPVPESPDPSLQVLPESAWASDSETKMSCTLKTIKSGGLIISFDWRKSFLKLILSLRSAQSPSNSFKVHPSLVTFTHPTFARTMKSLPVFFCTEISADPTVLTNTWGPASNRLTMINVWTRNNRILHDAELAPFF